MHPGQARLTWLLSVRHRSMCGHDVQNSLPLAIAPGSNSKPCLRGLFTIFESLRRSYSERIAHLPMWLSKSFIFEHRAALYPLQRARTLCGSPPKWIEQLAGWEDRTELPQVRMARVLKMWEWRRFSDSRWAPVGASCSSMLAACLGGLADFVGKVLANPSAHTFHLRGLQQMTREVKALISLIACSSCSSWRMAEPRCATVELEDTTALEMPAFDTIAGICGMNAYTLRHQVISSA